MSDFENLMNFHRIMGERKRKAVALIMGGKTQYAAAKEIGISESAVSRAMAKLRRPVCTECGQIIRDPR